LLSNDAGALVCDSAAAARPLHLGSDITQQPAATHAAAAKLGHVAAWRRALTQVTHTGAALTAAQAATSSAGAFGRATSDGYGSSAVAGNGAISATASLDWDFDKSGAADGSGSDGGSQLLEGGGGQGGGDEDMTTLFAKDMANLDNGSRGSSGSRGGSP
jgi:hypothetical protein